MTLIRAPWWPLDEIFESGPFCPLYCVTPHSETFLLGNTTTSSGFVRLASTLTGSAGTVLVMQDEFAGPTTNLGTIDTNAICDGLSGLALIRGSLISTAPIMSTSTPYTIELTGKATYSTSGSFTSISNVDVVNVVWHLGISISSGSFPFNPTVYTISANLVSICGFCFLPAIKIVVPIPPTFDSVVNDSCFRIRFSVDPCNHKTTIKFTRLSGNALFSWGTVGGTGFGAPGATSCIEILRTTPSVILDPLGSGQQVSETRDQGWPNLYGCERPAIRLNIAPYGIPLHKLEIRTGYEVC